MVDGLSNIYGQIVDWGGARIDKGVTQAEYLAFVRECKTKVSEARAKSIFLELFTPIELENPVLWRIKEAAAKGELFHLTVEAAFRHLERIELMEARNGAKVAVRWAAGSMALASLIGVLQLVGASNLMCLLSKFRDLFIV